MAAHSRLSASGSNTWLNCPASVKLSEAAPPKVTHPSAQVGTVAHFVAETALNYALKLSETDHKEMLGDEIDGLFVDRVMILGADLYVNYIMDLFETGDEILIEERVTLAHIHPDMFGTADCIIRKKSGITHVIDYKFGTWSVNPKENTQLIYYGLGSIKDTTPHEIQLHVVQPRSSDGIGTKSWTLPKDQIEIWEKKFKSKSEQADVGTPMNKGRWCMFAACKPICPLHLPREK